ncbi:hypothetical protein KIN20_015510 [Parelaphostrongylus tenuis]|uniref:Uncharacterized protein n=1 Tax=Parelaphostrongylus tenuis TaxID=148309 RepID=A0AAD5N496_PARTN|nr:hypothetical protein KIN20_015510 [Parelaphostrongylus tenuis]
MDTLSGDGDTPSHKMLLNLQTFLGDVNMSPRVTPSNAVSGDHEKTSAETNSYEVCKSFGARREHLQADPADGDADHVINYVVDMVIDHISIGLCRSADHVYEQAEQKTSKESCSTHVEESSSTSFVNVGLTLEEAESSGTVVHLVIDRHMTNSCRDVHGKCRRYVGPTVSAILEIKAFSSHDVGCDAPNKPCPTSALFNLSVKGANRSFDSIPQECLPRDVYASSEDVIDIQKTAEHYSFEEEDFTFFQHRVPYFL